MDPWGKPLGLRSTSFCDSSVGAPTEGTGRDAAFADFNSDLGCTVWTRLGSNYML